MKRPEVLTTGWWCEPMEQAPNGHFQRTFPGPYPGTHKVVVVDVAALDAYCAEVEQRIAAAVAQEREACAVVARQHCIQITMAQNPIDMMANTREAVAAAIRSRGAAEGK